MSAYIVIGLNETVVNQARQSSMIGQNAESTF
jgi:hypothetical protein